MTCTDKGALGGDWCGAPPLVWVELVPPSFWLEPAAVVDMLACCSFEGWVFCGFGDGGESLSGWVVKRELVLDGGLG
jgi:hypothetical protein